MPFTFSHPAIILPLINKRKKLFSSSGLIIGCIIPDFESFIRLTAHKRFSHTWLGMFWFDLPLAIIFIFIFHNVVRDPLIKNLPDFIKNKCTRFTGFNWNIYFRKHFLMILASMLTGIVSHLLWDAFTHLNLAHPNAIDSNIFIGHYRLFKILQYSNSLIGMIIIIVYMVRMPGDPLPAKHPEPVNMIFLIKPPKQKGYDKMQYWLIALLVTALAIAIGINIVHGYLEIVLLIDIVISGSLLSLILTPVIQNILRALSPKA